MKTSKADKLHAKRWKCAPTTIQNWRKSGAPLDGTDAEMQEFLHSQRTLPAGTRALLEESQPVDVVDAPRPQKKAGNGRKAELGAEHALSRLEFAEADADDRLRLALESGLPGAIKSARQHWLSIIRELRAYDESVDSYRRKAGDSVDRQSVEECIGLLCSLWASLCGASCQSVSRELVEATEPAQVVEILRIWFVNRLSHTLGNFAGTTLGVDPKVCIPVWMTKAVEQGFSKTSFTAGVGPRAERLRQVAALLLEEDDRTALQLIRRAALDCTSKGKEDGASM